MFSILFMAFEVEFGLFFRKLLKTLTVRPLPKVEHFLSFKDYLHNIFLIEKKIQK